MAEAALRRLAANTLRTLAMDGVQKANSGHPGMPMGMADVATVLFTQFLKFSPKSPSWLDRDRFVLSAGHGSMLLYGLLHLSGYDLPLDELKAFRQWGSRTPGHPEHGLTAGVEMTTGPLGQGVSTAVGLALAERMLAARFNRPEHEIVDHRTYVIASDGDLMEGVSHEACALAGHLGLGKLVVLYDDNRITIDGPTSLSFSEDVPARFAAYGWHVQRVDGHDSDAVEAAIAAAKAEGAQALARRLPDAHRLRQPEPAGHEQGARRAARSRRDPAHEGEARLAGRRAVPRSRRGPRLLRRGRRARSGRGRDVERPALGVPRRVSPSSPRSSTSSSPGGLPEGWEAKLPAFPADKPLATRQASGAVLDALVPAIPTLVGGSADLTPSNNTRAKSAVDVKAGDFGGSLPPLRHPRARHGRHPERPRAPRLPAVRRHVPRLLRLHEGRDPPRGAHGAAGRLRLHARLDRPRRGRPDAPAGRAARRAPRARPTSSSTAPPTRTRPPPAGASPSDGPTARRPSS